MASDFRLEDIIEKPRNLPDFLRASREAQRWLAAVILRIRPKQCGREELAWLLGVPLSALSEAIPSSADPHLVGSSLIDIGFLPQCSGCIIRGSRSSPHLNGRRCVLTRDLRDGDSHAVVAVEGGIHEVMGEGDVGIAARISRKNLVFVAPPLEVCEEEGWPSIDVVAPEIRVNEPDPTFFAEDYLGPPDSVVLPAHLSGLTAHLWLAAAVGRLVASKACGREEIEYLLALHSPPCGKAVSSSMHPDQWGQPLDCHGFVPAGASCAVEGLSSRPDLNGRLATLVESCPDGAMHARVAVDREQLQVHRRNLRLQPAPGRLMELGLVPEGTLCIIEGSSSRPELNGLLARLVEDCPEEMLHPKVAVKGEELHLHRKMLRIPGEAVAGQPMQAVVKRGAEAEEEEEIKAKEEGKPREEEKPKEEGGKEDGAGGEREAAPPGKDAGDAATDAAAAKKDGPAADPAAAEPPSPTAGSPEGDAAAGDQPAQAAPADALAGLPGGAATLLGWLSCSSANSQRCAALCRRATIEVCVADTPDPNSGAGADDASPEDDIHPSMRVTAASPTQAAPTPAANDAISPGSGPNPDREAAAPPAAPAGGEPGSPAPTTAAAPEAREAAGGGEQASRELPKTEAAATAPDHGTEVEQASRLPEAEVPLLADERLKAAEAAGARSEAKVPLLADPRPPVEAGASRPAPLPQPPSPAAMAVALPLRAPPPRNAAMTMAVATPVAARTQPSPPPPPPPRRGVLASLGRLWGRGEATQGYRAASPSPPPEQRRLLGPGGDRPPPPPPAYALAQRVKAN